MHKLNLIIHVIIVQVSLFFITYKEISQNCWQTNWNNLIVPDIDTVEKEDIKIMETFVINIVKKGNFNVNVTTLYPKVINYVDFV